MSPKNETETRQSGETRRTQPTSQPGAPDPRPRLDNQPAPLHGYEPVAGELMRTRWNYAGQDDKVDTIREPTHSRADWEQQHELNLTTYWQTHAPTFSMSPIGVIVLQYVSGGQPYAKETLCALTYNGGATSGNSVSWRRQALADMRAAWASNPADTDKNTL